MVICGVNKYIIFYSIVKNKEEIIIVCVILIWVVFNFFWDKWIDVIIDVLILNISLIFVFIKNKGVVIFIVVNVLLFIFWFIKILFVIINIVENIIFSIVGISNFWNNFGIFILLKLILFFINFIFLFSGCKDRMLFWSKNYYLVIFNYFFIGKNLFF